MYAWTWITSLSCSSLSCGSSISSCSSLSCGWEVCVERVEDRVKSLLTFAKSVLISIREVFELKTVIPLSVGSFG